MTDYRLRRSGQAPLRFAGELLYERDSRRAGAGGQERNRWHAVRIYRTDAMAYVVQVAYRSTWQGEQDHDEVTVLDSAAELGRVLESYDPCAYLLGFPPGEQYEERRQRIEAILRADWGAIVGEILDRDEFAVEAEAAATAQRDSAELARYRELRRATLSAMGLSHAEACLCMDALNGTMLLAEYGVGGDEWRFAAASIEDHVRLNQADAKWGVDAPTLLARVRRWTDLERLAIGEAAAEFWRRAAEPTDRVLADLGFQAE